MDKVTPVLFESLDKCLTFLRAAYPQQETVRDVPIGEEKRALLPVPKFLYRGECGLHRSTENGLERVRKNETFSANDREVLNQLHQALLWRFTQNDYTEVGDPGVGGVGAMAFPDRLTAAWAAEALLQHYGFPSNVIDFSSELDVAAAFAATRSDVRARICVLEKPINGHCATARFTDHPWVERPRRQAAYSVAPLGFTDLKSSTAHDLVGARWFEFPVTKEGILKWSDSYQRLIDLDSDPGAGILRSEINSFVAASGKLPHRVAEWLVARVPMVPRAFLNHAVDHESKQLDVWHVAPGKGPPFDPENERSWSLREWSDKFEDLVHRQFEFQSELPKTLGALYAYPGTLHVELCPA